MYQFSALENVDDNPAVNKDWNDDVENIKTSAKECFTFIYVVHQFAFIKKVELQ